MEKLIKSKVYWSLLIITLIGEFMFPHILSKFYNGYNYKTMTISELASTNSPVRVYYNSWLIWLGIFLCLTGVVFINLLKTKSKPLSITVGTLIITFAIGAGILAGLFSLNENLDVVTTSSLIHIIGSSIGFIALLFVPLFLAILEFKSKNNLTGTIDVVFFILAFIFMVLFIMSDKAIFSGTIISYMGLWERLTLASMYAPLFFYAVRQIKTL